MRADISGDALTWNGSTWSSPVSVDGTLDSVSCVSASLCVALGAKDVNGILRESAVTWNSSTWSAPQSITSDPSAQQPDSVSCKSSSFCMAVDNFGDALIGQTG